MKKYSLILFILAVFASNTFAQKKYIIYFKDKGSLTKESLLKKATLQSVAEQTLSQRSIKRRKKNLGNNYFTFEDLPIEKIYIKNLEKLDIKIANKLKWFNAVSAYLSDEQLLKLNSKPYIKKIEEVKILRSQKINGDISAPREKINKELKKKSNTSITYSYGPSLIQNLLSDIPAVHDLGITGEGVVIGILDSGFEWKLRTSLKNAKVIAEHDFVNNDTTTANGSFGHGTSVFSILAGFHEDNLIGPSFNSKFILAKTEYVPTETNLEEDNYAAALEWMDSIGVDITTSSLGYNIFDKGQRSYTYEDMDGKTTIVTKAAELAFSKGIITITAAGNDGNNNWKYIAAPADGTNIITVGSVNSSNKFASYSSRGPTFDGRIKPEVLAQGSSTYRATISGPDSYSSNGSGTSFATPIVAGITGLLLSAHPHLTNSQVRNILLESSDNVETPDSNRGYGLLSAIKAVTFPNIKKLNDEFILNKMFKKTDSALTQHVGIQYHYDYSDAINIGEIEPNAKGIYEFNLPEPSKYGILKFAFTITNENGDEKYREPKEGNYVWMYGEDDVHLVLNVPSQPTIPRVFILYQNYPNPFNPTTTIKYSIPVTKKNRAILVKLKVFNILGEEVSTLVNSIQSFDKHEVVFNSSSLASGVYFYRLTVGSFSETKKMIYLR